MTNDKNSAARLDMSQPLPPQAAEFARKLHGMMDGNPKDETTVERAFEGLDEMFDLIAAGLYSLASMLVGEGEASIGLVEDAVANTDVAVGTGPECARHNSRLALSAAAIALLAQRDPVCLAAPEGLEPAQTCIGDDDLDAAGMSREELERMFAGPDRDRVRNWLESLPTAMRTVFVLRAVAGLSAVETAELLEQHGGPLAAGWTAEQVRELFRQGMCSVASQLIHEGVTTGGQ
jgi:DNA-directed RNA polymerase specialized sigma24 family protein